MPATKTFTAQLAAVAAVAEALGPVPWNGGDWERLPETVEEVLADPGPALRAAEHLGEAQELVCLGARLSDVRGARGRAQAPRGHRRAGGGLVVGRLSPRARDRRARGIPLPAVSAGGPAAADVEELAARIARAGATVLRLCDRPRRTCPIPPGCPSRCVRSRLPCARSSSR